MKKIICTLLCVIFLSLGLTTASFAEQQPEIKFNKDYTVMYFDGNEYTRINSDGFEYYGREFYSSTEGYDISLKPTDNPDIDTVNIYIDTEDDTTIVDVDISYKDGSTLLVSFLDIRYLNEYNKIINKKTDTAYIYDYYSYDGDNTDAFETKYSALFENPSETINVGVSWLDYSNYFNVYSCSKDKTLCKDTGYAFIWNEVWYYFDLEENDGIDYFNNGIFENVKLTVHKITDADAINVLEKCVDYVYAEDYGYVYDDNFTMPILIFICILIFAIIPLVILIFSLILMLKTEDKIYKKIFRTIIILCIAEIAVFIVTFYLIASGNFVRDYAQEIIGNTIVNYNGSELGPGTI